MIQSEYRKLMQVYCMSGVWCSYTHNCSDEIRGKTIKCLMFYPCCLKNLIAQTSNPQKTQQIIVCLIIFEMKRRMVLFKYGFQSAAVAICHPVRFSTQGECKLLGLSTYGALVLSSYYNFTTCVLYKLVHLILSSDSKPNSNFETW